MRLWFLVNYLRAYLVYALEDTSTQNPREALVEKDLVKVVYVFSKRITLTKARRKNVRKLA